MTLLHPKHHPCRAALFVSAALGLWSCGGSGSSRPPAPGLGPPTPPGAIRVTGAERLTWTQPGSGSDIGFRAYVDGVAVDLGSTSCAPSTDGDCSSPLPSMADGVHTIHLTAVSAYGGESEPSNSLTLHKVSAASAAVAAALQDAATGVETILIAPDGQAFAADAVARSLKAPLQLAPIPDGRLLVAEGDGRVSVMHPGEPDRDGIALDTRTLLDRSSVGVPGLAVHPDFARNRFVYTALVSGDGDGERLRIVRLREAGGVLGEPATVFEAPLVAATATSGAAGNGVDDVSSRAAAAGARLAFGPDGLLYALLSPGAEFDREPAASRPLASIVRLDDTGRLANPGAVAGVAARPLGLAWHPATSELLAVVAADDGTAAIAPLERGGVSEASNAVVEIGARDRRAVRRLRVAPDDDRVQRLQRAFIEALGEQRTTAIRFTVPVTLDGLPGQFSGELLDLVISGGTIYAAVAGTSASGQSEDRTGVVVRLRPR